jgi:hypothetical protein
MNCYPRGDTILAESIARANRCQRTADCGKEEGEGGAVTLKVCKACMSVKYCNALCQKKHWPTHKRDCKLRAAELHDEALFKDPPAKEDCPIESLASTRDYNVRSNSRLCGGQ